MSQRINATSLRERIQAKENLQLVDVRSPGEYAAGHVACAANIPLEQLETRLPDLSTSAQVVLICESGQRATAAAGWLCDHNDVLILERGTKGWREAGFPVVQTVSSQWSLERQVRFGAGLLVLTGTLLAVLVDSAWVYLAMFIGAGLTFAGLSGICPMGIILARLPWNSPKVEETTPAVAPCCSQVETQMKQ
jgi:rhodanese-related sulfurtransferase